MKYRLNGKEISRGEMLRALGSLASWVDAQVKDADERVKAMMFNTNLGPLVIEKEGA